MTDHRDTNVRTYSRAEWDAMQSAWADLGDDWAPWRELAKRHGIVAPPNTVGADDWNADGASQAALIARSCEMDPELMRYAISVSRDWFGVLAVALEERDAAKLAAEQAEDRYRRERDTYATQREAAASLAGILTTLADSVGTAPPLPVTRSTAITVYLGALQDRAAQFHDANHGDSAWWVCTNDMCAGMRYLLEGGAPMDSE